MRTITTLAALLLLVSGTSLEAQRARWVWLGASEKADSMFVDTVGVVRVDGTVGAWADMKFSSATPIPGRDSLRYVSTLIRYKMECRTRTFTVTQKLYVDAEGVRREDGYFRAAGTHVPELKSPAPDSWEELVLNYFCSKARPQQPEKPSRPQLDFDSFSGSSQLLVMALR